MLGHLVAQFPGQRLRQLTGQCRDRSRQGVCYSIGLVVATGQRDQHQEPCRPFLQHGYRAHVPLRQGFRYARASDNEVRGSLVDPSALAQAARAASNCGEESVDIRGSQIPRDSGANPNVK